MAWGTQSSNNGMASAVDSVLSSIFTMSSEVSLDKWALHNGRMHRAYLEAAHPGLYERLILNETLDRHLADAEERAKSMLERLIGQMVWQEGITEGLKASDQLEWVQRMNSIRSRVEEIVQAEVINTL